MNALLPRLGGPMGRHASGRGVWFNPLPWVLLAGTVLFLLLFLRHVPCIQTTANETVDAYIRLCYSDIQTSFLGQGYGRGESPVGTDQMLFAPLIAVAILASRKVSTALFDAPITRSGSVQDQVEASVTFFAVTSVGLFVCFLITLVALGWLGRRTRERTSWDAMVVAASPIVLAAGLINWDLVPIALTTLGLVQVARGRFFEGGVVLGLAASAGTMPIGVVVAVLVAVGLREGLRSAVVFGLPAVATFFLIHLPLLTNNLDRVYAYYHQEINKEMSYGSIWYVLSLMFGWTTRHTGSIAFVLLLLGLGVLIAYLFVTGKRPRVESLVAVVILTTALLGPAFPPQTSLWLVIAVVLARPYRAELVALTVTQVGYYAAVWGWLGGGLTTNQNGPYVLYWLAILFRVAVEVWILVNVVGDTLRPNRYEPSGQLSGDASPPSTTSSSSRLATLSLGR